MAPPGTQREVALEVHLPQRVRARVLKPPERRVPSGLGQAQQARLAEDGGDGGGRRHALVLQAPAQLAPAPQLGCSRRSATTRASTSAPVGPGLLPG